jgi:hypothetical protein
MGVGNGMGVQIADEGFDGVHQESVILENIPKEKILGKLSEQEAKAGVVEETFTAPPIDSVLNLYDLEQVRCHCSMLAKIMKCGSFLCSSSASTSWLLFVIACGTLQ